MERNMKFFYILTVLVLTLFVNSCATRYVPVQTKEVQHNEYTNLRIDSVHVVDSVLIYIKGDTMRETRFRDRWREIIVRDTIIRCDTIPKIEIVEVEKKQTFWEMVKLKTWPFFAVIICFVCFIFIIKRGLGAS